MDIEDLAKESKDLLTQSTPTQSTVHKKRKCAGKQEKSDPKILERIHDKTGNNDFLHSNVPGTQKVHIKTYGCSHNTSDSEFMMGLLYDYGYDIVDDVTKSDICIINSCTVKNPSQDAFITYVTKSREYGKPVVVAGCVPQGDRNLKGLENCSVIGVNQIDRIVEVVEETLKGNIILVFPKIETAKSIKVLLQRNGYSVAAVNAYVGQFFLPRSHGLMVNGLEIPARVLGLHVLAGVVDAHRREGHLDNERLGTGAEGEVALGVAPVGHIAAGVHLAVGRTFPASGPKWRTSHSKVRRPMWDCS